MEETLVLKPLPMGNRTSGDSGCHSMLIYSASAVYNRAQVSCESLIASSMAWYRFDSDFGSMLRGAKSGTMAVQILGILYYDNCRSWRKDSGHGKW
jgi:hypothetical protein